MLADNSQEPKLKLITVNMDVQFMVPMIDDKHSTVNGWTLEEVIKDWFEHSNINAYHCARNRSEIGGSKVIKTISVSDAE